MDKNISKFLEKIKVACQEFKQLTQTEVLLFHHNDADGLTSGTILIRAFSRLGLSVRSYSLEKPYPEVLDYIFQNHNKCKLVVFTDFGSGMLQTISDSAPAEASIFVLDHHGISRSSCSRINLINCLDYDISGSTDCSASSICALFASYLHKDNQDLLPLGVLGALGDGHVNQVGLLSGINAHVFELAKQYEFARYEDAYHGQLGSKWELLTDRVEDVNALGSIDYLRGGPDVAIKALSEGFDERVAHYVTEASQRYSEAIGKFEKNIELRDAANSQSFILNQDFADMGVKTVGLVCEHLIQNDFVDKSKYLIGFQTIPNKIPGIGNFEFNKVKISFRLPPAIHELVKQQQKPSFQTLVPELAKRMDSFVDACHIHAAAMVIDIGREDELIKIFEELVT